MNQTEPDIGPQTDEARWDERYRSKPQTWSGEPNAVLVAEVSDLEPGCALDVGSGEGGDALWLAARGWEVTGVELSGVALDRAGARAAALSLDATWEHRDLSREPMPGTYDLVTSFFVHLPAEARRVFFTHLADAVAPGGTLLVVGHHPSDGQTTMQRPDLAERGWTAEEVAGSLGPGWEIQVVQARPRHVTDPEGREVTIHDAVLRARRASGR